nr:MAG TPA: hypothetical protein [Caudoviricetes sp.]
MFHSSRTNKRSLGLEHTDGVANGYWLRYNHNAGIYHRLRCQHWTWLGRLGLFPISTEFSGTDIGRQFGVVVLFECCRHRTR